MNIIKKVMVKQIQFFHNIGASHWVCLSVILINSVFKMGKSYYLQVFLEEFQYAVKENKMNKFIN